ncbi:MAG: tyrosine-type recombinase/integrase, partial [Chloracidobacterium sp.]|nr:tyrosine-type recombinase/integrase [Chloracidobacterium sp.]
EFSLLVTSGAEQIARGEKIIMLFSHDPSRLAGAIGTPSEDAGGIDPAETDQDNGDAPAGCTDSGAQTVSVYKRNKLGRRVEDDEAGTWNYDFTEDSVRHRKALRHVHTRKEAEAVEHHQRIKVLTGAADQELIKDLTNQIAELNAQVKGINSNKAGDKEIKFEDFIKQEYLPEKLLSNPETYREHESQAKVYSAFFKGRLMHEITPADVRAYRQERLNGQKRGGGSRAISTLNKETWRLSGVFQLAVQNGYIKQNVAHSVKSVPVDNAREKVLEIEEEAKLFEWLAVNDQELHDAAMLARYAGLRLRESIYLDWEQVELESRIDSTGFEKGRKLTIKGKGKGRKKKKADIPLNDTAFEVLASRRANCDGTGRVFPSLKNYIKVSARFAKICDDLGMADVTFHTLRHTFCTLILESGASVEHARRLMRHSNIGTTQKYSHLRDDSLRGASKTMDERNGKKPHSGPIFDSIMDAKTDETE